MAEPTFNDVFKQNMDLLHLPTPKALYESVGAAMALVSALSAAIKAGQRSLPQIFVAASAAGAAGTGGAAAGEAIAAVGGMTASLYLGLAAGCAIDAAWETHGPAVSHEIGRALIKVADATGQPLESLLGQAIEKLPQSQEAIMDLILSVRISAGPVPRLGGSARKGR